MLTSLFRRAVTLYRGGDSSLFAPHGHPSPFKSLIDQGEDLELARYSKLTEFQLWYLVDSWTSHKDSIVSELSSRLLERRLFKTVPIDHPEKFHETHKQLELARSFTQELYPHCPEASDYFVMVDEPDRTSYKTYDWRAEAADESIWLVGGTRPPSPLEADEESTIVSAFKKKRYFPRIVVLPDVRDKLVCS